MAPTPDRRGPLRRALESGSPEEGLAAIKARTVEDLISGCWLWKGAKKPSGYPYLRGRGAKNEHVHRLVYELVHGRPDPRHAIHHSCSNPLCVSPEHLQEVTPSQNRAEVGQRSALEERIGELEAALAAVDPAHPLVTQAPQWRTQTYGWAGVKAYEARTARRAAARERAAERVRSRFDQVMAVEELRRSGVPALVACERVGITRQTYERWCIRIRGGIELGGEIIIPPTLCGGTRGGVLYAA